MSDFTFNGFEPANTTPVPDVLFDVLLSELSEAELKVLLYIIRRTAGFKKQTDAISLTQFQKGIRKRATGEILDKGCGVKDRATIVKALASLEKMGCIESTKSNDPQGDKATSAYRVRFRSGVVGKTNHPNDIGSGQNQPPWFAKPTTGSGESQPGVVGKTNPQETVIQPNSKQETDRQEGTYSEHESEPAASGSLIASPTHAQSSQDVPYRPDFTANESRIANRTQGDNDYGQRTDARRTDPAPLHHFPARGATDPAGTDLPQVVAQAVASQDTPAGAGDGYEKPVQASEQAQFSTGRNSFPQSAKVEPEPPKRGRGQGKKAAEPPPEFTAEGRKVYEAWCALFKSPPRTAEKTVDCANDLYARLVPWCQTLHVTCKELLKDIKGWLYATDPDWYRRKGVTLCDIGSKFESWQSVKTEELEQANKPKSTPSRIDPVVAQVRAMKQKYAPAEVGGTI